MRLTARCIFGTLLAVLSLSWIAAASGEEDFQGDKGSEPCAAILIPEGPCKNDDEETTCPYLFSMPPMTINLPLRLKELEQIVEDLQKLKDNVDQLRKMCADCTVSQTESECGRQTEREHEKLHEDIDTREDGMVLMNETNIEILRENERDSRHECGTNGVKTENTVKGDGDTASEKRDSLKESERKIWDSKRETNKTVVKENEKEETLREVPDSDGKTHRKVDGVKGKGKLVQTQVPAGGRNEGRVEREEVVDKNHEETETDVDKVENSKRSQEDTSEKKHPSKVRNREKAEESDHHVWQDETKKTEKKTQTEDDRTGDRIKMSVDDDEHTKEDRDQHKEERKKEMEKEVKTEQNKEKPKQTERTRLTETEKTEKEGEDREKEKKIKTGGEKTVQGEQNSSDGDLKNSKTIERTDLFSDSLTPHSTTGLTSSPKFTDLDNAVTLTSSPFLSSPVSHSITDVDEEVKKTADGLNSKSTNFMDAGSAEYPSFDSDSGFRTSSRPTTATISPLEDTGQKVTRATIRFTGTVSQGKFSSTKTTFSTTSPRQSYTTTFSPVTDHSRTTSKKIISSNTKTGVNHTQSQGPKHSEKHKPGIKPEADHTLKHPKNDRKLVQAPLPDKKTNNDQRLKPPHQKPTTDQKSPESVQIPKHDQRPQLHNLPVDEDDEKMKSEGKAKSDEGSNEYFTPVGITEFEISQMSSITPNPNENTLNQLKENNPNPSLEPYVSIQVPTPRPNLTDVKLKPKPHQQIPKINQKPKPGQNITKINQKPKPGQNITKINQKPKPGQNITKINQKPKPGQDITKINQKPKPGQDITKINQKPKPGQNITKINQKPKPGQNITKINQKPKPGQDITKINQKPKSEQNITKINQKPKPGQNVPKINQKPKPGQNITNINQKPKPGQNITKINQKPKPGQNVPKITQKPKPGQNITKINQKPKPGQNIPKINQKPKPGQEPKDTFKTPDLDQIPEAESNTTPKQWPPPGIRPSTRSTSSPGATPAQKLKPAVQSESTPKTKTDLNPTFISGGPSENTHHTETSIHSTSGPIKLSTEVTHSQRGTEFSPNDRKPSPVGPKTSNTLDPDPLPHLNTLPEGFTLSPSSRIKSDLKPQTTTQPPSILWTTRPKTIFDGTLKSLMSSTTPRPTSLSSKTDSNSQSKVSENLNEIEYNQANTPAPYSSVQTTSTVSSDIRSNQYFIPIEKTESETSTSSVTPNPNENHVSEFKEKDQSPSAEPNISVQDSTSGQRPTPDQTDANLKPKPNQEIPKIYQKPKSGQNITKINLKPKPGQNVPKITLKPKPGQNITKINLKPKPGQNITKINLKPKPGQNITKINLKPKPGHDITKINLKPKPGQNITEINLKPKPGQNIPKIKPKPGHDITKINLKPKPGQNITKINLKPKPGQNITKINLKPKPGHDITKINFKPKPGQNVPKIDQKPKPGQVPKINQKHPKSETDQKTKLEPKSEQVPKDNSEKSDLDQIPDAESNTTPKQWPPPGIRPPTRPTFSPDATPAPKLKPAVQSESTPKTKTDLDPTFTSGGASENTHHTETGIQPTSGPIKLSTEVTHSQRGTEFSTSDRKPSPVGPKTSNTLDPDPLPHLNTLPEGFTLSPSGRIKSDLKPQTTTQPPSILWTTRPKTIFGGTLKSLMSSTTPRPTSLSSNSDSESQSKIFEKVDEMESSWTTAPDKTTTPVSFPSVQTTTAVSSEFRSTTTPTSASKFKQTFTPVEKTESETSTSITQNPNENHVIEFKEQDQSPSAEPNVSVQNSTSEKKPTPDRTDGKLKPKPNQQIPKINQKPKPGQNVTKINQKLTPEQNVPKINQKPKPGQNITKFNQKPKPGQNVPKINQKPKPGQNVPKINQKPKPRQNITKINLNLKPGQNITKINQNLKPGQNVPKINQKPKPGQKVPTIDEKPKPGQNVSKISQKPKPDQTPKDTFKTPDLNQIPEAESNTTPKQWPPPGLRPPTRSTSSPGATPAPKLKPAVQSESTPKTKTDLDPTFISGGSSESSHHTETGIQPTSGPIKQSTEVTHSQRGTEFSTSDRKPSPVGPKTSNILDPDPFPHLKTLPEGFTLSPSGRIKSDLKPQTTTQSLLIPGTTRPKTIFGGTLKSLISSTTPRPTSLSSSTDSNSQSKLSENLNEKESSLTTTSAPYSGVQTTSTVSSDIRSNQYFIFIEKTESETSTSSVTPNPNENAMNELKENDGNPSLQPTISVQDSTSGQKPSPDRSDAKLKPKPIQQIPKINLKPKPGQNVTKISQKPKPRHNITKINQKPKPGQNITKINLKPKPGQNITKISQKPKPGQNITKITQKPKPGQNITKITQKPKPGQNITKINLKPKPGQNITKINLKPKPGQNVPKIDQKPKPGQVPKINQKHPSETDQKTKLKPKPEQVPKDNSETSDLDQIPDAESNTTPKRWPPPGLRLPTRPTFSPDATPAPKLKPAVQSESTPKTKTDLDPTFTSGGASENTHHTETDVHPTSGPIKLSTEVTHSQRGTEFSTSDRKPSPVDPKTSNTPDPDLFPHLNILPEGFTLSPSGRIKSDLKPQTTTQPPSILRTTRPKTIFGGTLKSLMSSTTPRPTSLSSNTNSKSQSILENVKETASSQTSTPDKTTTSAPPPSVQTTSTVSSGLRSTTTTSGPEAPAEVSTPTARELRVKINQVAAFLNNSINPKLRPKDTTSEDPPEVDGRGSTFSTLTPKVVRDCSDHLLRGKTQSGVYLVTPDLRSRSFSVFCDMELNGGGWTVLQRRKDGSVNFSRLWDDYRDGFGDLAEGEFWLGNNLIHLLTRERDMVLRVELEDFDGVTEFAEYEHFKVASERMRFRLTVGGYSGTAGDALRFSKRYDHNNRAFTTPDRDHDRYPSGNCGAYYSSGWWFDACMAANLNGKYYSGRYKGVRDGIFWGTWHNISTEYYPTNERQSFRSVRMMIRPKGFTP